MYYRRALLSICPSHPLRRIGACGRLKDYVEYLGESDSYKDRVLFLNCSKEASNQDLFEKYKIKTIPTFLFIKNNKQVASSSTESPDEVKAAIDGLLNGEK